MLPTKLRQKGQVPVYPQSRDNKKGEVLNELNVELFLVRTETGCFFD